jgi:tetratricopeptide (TPR) repeat protein
MCKLVAVVLLASTIVLAQQSAPAAKSTLLTGFGDHQHHPVTTKNPEAQKYFDQGLRLIYGFNHDEAARAFTRSSELDPNMAMAYWGIALAVGPNYNLPVDPEREKLAYENISKARALSANLPAQERAYIEALAKRYTNMPNPDYQALAVAYKDAMREVSRRYPDDLDAATLYAESLMNLNPWGLWNKDGAPWQHTPEILEVLTSVMRRDPNHIGANHYYIHAIEASPHPENGLVAANRLAALAPASGHLVHMPAHIYIRTGAYTNARTTNENAARADEQYIRATGAKGIYPMMYYSHNLHFIAMAAAMEGRYRDAREGAARLAAHVAPHIRDMPPLETFLLIPTSVLLRFERWDEILKLPQPDPNLKLSTTYWQYAQGMALASTGKPEAADKYYRAVAAAHQATPPDAIFSMPFNNKTKDILAIARDVLGGQIAMGRGDFDNAARLFQSAVVAQDSLRYGEPPDWYFPVREALGNTFLAKRDYKQAEEVFRADLARNPRNGRSLFGLAQTLKAQGRTYDEYFVRREFELAWKNADTPLKTSVEVATR